MKHRFGLVVMALLLLIANVGVPQSVHAASNGSISILSFTSSSTDYTFTATGTTDDTGNGYDIVAIVCVNADGTVSDVDLFYIGIGATETDSSDCDQEFGPAYNGPLTLEFWDPGTYSNEYENSAAGLAYARSGVLMATTSGGTACVNTDGRLNPCEGGATAAVYCENGGVTVYAIYNGVGYLAFKISKEQIAKFPLHPKKNTLIIQKLGARLYRLTSGELQINRMGTEGKEYHFIWGGCDGVASSAGHSGS